MSNESPYAPEESPHADLSKVVVGLARRLESTVSRLKKIQSMCGNPDASEACRLIILEAQEEIEALTMGYGDPRRTVRR